MDTEQNHETKFEILIRYPKGVSAERFKAYLESKNIDLKKLKKYLKDLDQHDEAMVLCSSDDAKLKKAIAAFHNLGFEVEKAVHFELAAVDDSQHNYSIYRCPVCDTPRDQDEPGQEQPCSVCKFIHLPDASAMFIMKKRIEWEELQRIKAEKRNQSTTSSADRQAEVRRILEEKLRKEIRAELMKKYNIGNDQKRNWFSLWKLIPAVAAIALVFFVSGYYSGENGLFWGNDEDVAAPSGTIKIDQEKLLATLEKYTDESVQFEFAGEDGVSVQPELISSSTNFTENSLVSPDTQSGSYSTSTYQCGLYSGSVSTLPMMRILRAMAKPH